MPRRKLDANKATWPNKVDAATNDPARIDQRKNIGPGVTVPRRG